MGSTSLALCAVVLDSRASSTLYVAPGAISCIFLEVVNRAWVVAEMSYVLPGVSSSIITAIAVTCILALGASGGTILAGHGSIILESSVGT